MNLSIIAAIGKNNELGKDNKLIWHLPRDLKFFKNTTMNKTIVMGHNTYLSLPQKLSGRKYVVLSFKELKLDPDIDIYHSREELLESIKDSDDEMFIIGGASMYEQFLNDCEKLYLTEIDAEAKADAYFPQFDREAYDKFLVAENEENGIKYKHMVYRRK